MLVHTVGILAMLCTLLSIQMEHKNKYLLFQILGAIFFANYFLLLGGYAGVLTNSIMLVQGIIALIYLKQNKEVPKLLIGLLLSLTVISGFFIVNNLLDILPLLAVIVALIIYLQKSEKRIRYLSLIMAVWIPYAIYFQAHFSLITSIFFLISTLIAIYRYDLKKT